MNQLFPYNDFFLKENVDATENQGGRGMNTIFMELDQDSLWNNALWNKVDAIKLPKHRSGLIHILLKWG